MRAAPAPAWWANRFARRSSTVSGSGEPVIVSMAPVRRTLPTSLTYVHRSPCELDLELASVVPDLELELELHLVGNVHLETQASSVELDLVVFGQRVGERVQAGGGGLSAQQFLLGDLHQVHYGLLRVELADSRSRPRAI